MTGWLDNGEPVQPVALSAAVVEMVREFESRFDCGCDHPSEPQLAAPSDLRSMCSACARDAKAMTSWTSAGPCHACGRMLSAPPEMVWLLNAPHVGVVLACRLCAQCEHDMERPIEETMMTNDQGDRCCRSCFDRVASAAGGGALTAAGNPLHRECAAVLRRAAQRDLRATDDRKLKLANLRAAFAAGMGSR